MVVMYINWIAMGYLKYYGKQMDSEISKNSEKQVAKLTKFKKLAKIAIPK